MKRFKELFNEVLELIRFIREAEDGDDKSPEARRAGGAQRDGCMYSTMYPIWTRRRLWTRWRRIEGI